MLYFTHIPYTIFVSPVLLFASPRLAYSLLHTTTTGLAYRDQVRAEISELKAMQLLKRQEATKRYSVQIAHDLGTPLQGLTLAVGEAAALHQAGAPYDALHVQKNFDVLQTCTNSLKQLREMMMDEIKLQLGQQLLPNQDTVDPVLVLNNVLAIMGGKACANEITLDIVLPLAPPLPHIVTDGRWLSIMTTNLTSNAIKHAKLQVRVVVLIDGATEGSSEYDGSADDDGGAGESKVKSTLNRRHQGSTAAGETPGAVEEAGEAERETATVSLPTLRVSVHDDGPGISKTIAKSLFGLYCRGQERDGGSGIGLYSVKVQCETLGGRCGFGKSSLLGGAEVWFEIPFRPDLMATMAVVAAGTGDSLFSTSTRAANTLGTRSSGGGSATSASGEQNNESSGDPLDAFIGEANAPLPPTESSSITDGGAATTTTTTPITTTAGNIDTATIIEGGGSSGGGDGEEGAHSRSGAAAAATGTHVAPQDSTPRRSTRILLVDDSPVILMMVGAILVREGYEVDKATNGREGLERMQQRDYDVVISDLQMPVMDGFAMTSEVRAREAKLQSGRHHPVIVMSANTTESDIALALSTGADAFLAKPAQPDEILGMISDLLAPEGGSGGSHVRSSSQLGLAVNFRDV